MATPIKFKRGTRTAFEAGTLLAAGEPGFVTDDGLFFVGDGATANAALQAVNTAFMSNGAPSLDANDFKGCFVYDYADLDLYVSRSNDGGSTWAWVKCGVNELSEMTGDLDDIANGTTYGRVLNTELSSGQVAQVRAVTGTADVTGDQIKSHLDSVANPHSVTLQQAVTAGGSVTSGSISIGTGVGFSITDAPTNDTDGANKAYVDSVVQGLDAKGSVVAKTNATSDLSGYTYSGDEWTGVTADPVIDGITVVDGERILITHGDADLSHPGNGIWVYDATNDKLVRADDSDTWDKLISAFTFVEEGTANSDTGWVLTIDAGGSLGTTDITFTQFAGAADVSAGAGLTKSGNTINMGDAGKGVQVNADDSEIDASEIAGSGIAAADVQSSGNSWELELDAAAAAGDGLAANGVNAYQLDIVATDFVDTGKGLEVVSNDIGVNLESDGGLAFDAVNDGIEITPDSTTGATVAPVSVGSNGVGVTVDNDSIVHSSGTLSVNTVDGGSF